MSAATVPTDETDRLAALGGLGAFDAPPDAGLAALVRAATLACGTSLGAIGLVDAECVRLLAPVGLPEGGTLPRDQALCSHAILGEDLLEVPDMRADARSAAYPIVTGEPHLRFYAGMPLRLRGGQAIGTLCLADTAPRQLTEAQHEVLRNLARAAASLMEQALATRQLAEAAERHATSEARLRRSEEFLDRTGQAAGVGGWELDAVTQHLHWSSETKRIHGVPADYEPSLTTAIDFYAPQARPVIRAAVEHAIETGEGWDLELELIRLDGTPIWVRAMGSVTFADGKPVRLSGAFQDVTGNVARRLLLEQAHERIRLAAESGGIGIWDWDFATGVITTDAQRRRLFGLPADADAQAYVEWRRYVHPDDREVAERALADARAGLAPYNVDYRVVWDDGSVHHLRSAAHIVRDPANRPLRMVGVAWDVTDSRALAAELKRNADLQAAAFARETALFCNSPDSLTILRIDDEDGERVYRFEAVSPSVVAVTGLAPEQLIGQRIGSGLPAAAAAALLQSCEACVAADATVAFSFSLDTPGGRRELEGSRTPIHDPVSGRIVRLAGVMRDVTERKRLEAIAAHAQKMETIGTLAAGVAHDFNNILQSISGSVEMVQDEVAPGSQAHDFAGVALRAARRGAYLTHHLLSYARRQTLLPQEIDVGSMLGDLQILLRRTLGPQIQLRLQVGRPVPRVRADPGQMQTALLNLAINASHAMPEGGALSIEAQPLLEQGAGWVAISVTDEGCGMDEATLARAVEPFFTTKGVKGTGLGLSMVQGFAVQSGGRMSIVSAPGRGTTVGLWLPAVEAAVAGDPAPQRAVLLVDDDSDILVTIGAFLEKSGFGTLRAASGLEALRLLAQGCPVDALITDFAMPGMNGGDLVTEARMIRPDLPAAVISGVAVAAAGRVPPGVMVLHKPFAREALLEALQALLGPLQRDRLQPDAAEATMEGTTTERR